MFWCVALYVRVVPDARQTVTAALESALPASGLFNSEQIVENLVSMNRERIQALHAYHGTRTYRIDYHGLSGSYSAEMNVDITYQLPGVKEFIIRSSTGSKLILDKVLIKLLEAEKEGATVEGQRRTDLNEENYKFTLIGYEPTPLGLVYVLAVEPWRRDKFLYRGRIWVNAEDFAVTRLEAEPAKIPSFWTNYSEIQETYRKVGDFWLPARNHSVTMLRFGGHAELTIEYSNYQITDANPVADLSCSHPARLATVR